MQVNLGDRLRVTGIIQQYYGLTEIQSFSELTLISRNHPLPEPLVLTCAQVANSFLEDFSEPNESRLIRINNVRKIGDIDQYTSTIADYSGSCILFLDGDAKLPRPPEGYFDVIGILKQYDKSSVGPLTGGYEISPRFAEDFISKSGPIFLQRPREIDVNSRSVTIHWRTNKPSTTLLRYGRSETYELGAVGDSSATTDHTVTITNLQPATMYHGRAYSTDSSGTSRSDDLVFMTASESSSGTIKVYFTKSIDANYAAADTALGNCDLAAITIDLINRARYSLDVCYYSLTHYNIAEALRNARKRGVSVRFIYESENANLQISALRDLAGIPIINDRFGENDGRGAMHNKFIIIDHRDHSSTTDDLLWVGSANATEGGSYENAENMLLIQDEALCAAYTAEFNEMWGSDGEVPNPTNSRFGFRKKDNTPHLFRIGGRLVEQYMSPSDDAEAAIIRAIDRSQNSCYFCILTFTSTGVFKTMENKFFNMPNYLLRGVFERSEAGSLSWYPIMSGQGANSWQPPADVHLDVIPKFLHHKYAIIDWEKPDAEAIVITGSHNWSGSANTINDENTLIIHDRQIANLYLQEFAARYRESGGRGAILSHVRNGKSTIGVANEFILLANHPNPFNQQTRLSIWIPESQDKPRIEIFNIVGERVRDIVISAEPNQWYTVIWDGSDEQQRWQPSGVYFARVVGTTQVIKMILLR